MPDMLYVDGEWVSVTVSFSGESITYWGQKTRVVKLPQKGKDESLSCPHILKLGVSIVEVMYFHAKQCFHNSRHSSSADFVRALCVCLSCSVLFI